MVPRPEARPQTPKTPNNVRLELISKLEVWADVILHTSHLRETLSIAARVWAKGRPFMAGLIEGGLALPVWEGCDPLPFVRERA
eukprot:6216769-Pyramimonas_sp.AAC.1